MYNHGKFRYRHQLYWLLALVIGLRALLAPGFMLSYTGDGPLGIGITLCGGFNSHPLPMSQVNADDPHAHHAGHAGDNHHPSLPQHTAHEEGGLTACGIWATSATYVADAGLDFAPAPQITATDFQLPVTSSPVTIYLQSPQQPRAPPYYLSRIYRSI